MGKPRSHYRDDSDWKRYRRILIEEYADVLSADDALILRLTATSLLYKIEKKWHDRGGVETEWRNTPTGYVYITKKERMATS